MRKKVLIIANPCSGKCKSKKVIGFITKEFALAGYVTTVCFTECMGDAERLARENANGQDLVVCIGGDGTLNELINGLLKAEIKVPVGYIPMGCTNDFARSMKISKNYKKAVRQILAGKGTNLDICKINDRYFVYVASFGLFSATSSTPKQKLKNRLGYLAYVFLGVKELFDAKEVQLSAEVEGEQISGNFILGCFCNTKSMGGVVKFKSSQVDMNDGKMEMLLIRRPKSLHALNSTLRSLKRNKWDNPNIIMRSISRAQNIKMSSGRWSLDGELYKEDGEVNVQIIKDAVTFKL